MIKFKRPSVTVFQSRKKFHSCQRTQTESANEWLQRIKHSIKTCDYGAFHEVMFIDKFLSGLDDDDFTKLMQLATWSEEQFQLHLNGNQVVDHGNLKTEFVDSAIDDEPVIDFVIKEEDPKDHIDFHFQCIDENKMIYTNECIDTKSDADQELDLHCQNDPVQSTYSNGRNESDYSNYEQKPASKRKGWRKIKDPGLYVCQICNVDCVFLSKFKRHLKKHRHLNRSFECYMCGSVYQRLGSLKLHFTKIHKHKKTNKIALDQHKAMDALIKLDQVSNSSQKRDTNMQQRLNSANESVNNSKVKLKGFLVNKSSGSILCLDCGKSYKQMNAYNKHKRMIHIGIKPHKCNICGKRFDKEVQLDLHNVVHNHQIGSLECYLCSTKYERWFNLRIHFVRFHTPRIKRNFKCTLCSKAFLTQRNLEFHTKIHQGLIEGHKCQQCDKVFDTKADLNKHLVVHLKTREFICETCGRAYKSDNHLKQHATIHNTNRRFKCTECGQVLSNTSTLKNHMRLHTGERPYICDLCGKSFKHPTVLSKHLKRHRNEKPHACTLCDKKFVTNYHLKRHINTHTGNRLFACNQCDRSFMQSGTLKAHQLKIHGTSQPLN